VAPTLGLGVLGRYPATDPAAGPVWGLEFQREGLALGHSPAGRGGRRDHRTVGVRLCVFHWAARPGGPRRPGLAHEFMISSGAPAWVECHGHQSDGFQPGWGRAAVTSLSPAPSPPPSPPATLASWLFLQAHHALPGPLHWLSSAPTILPQMSACHLPVSQRLCSNATSLALSGFQWHLSPIPAYHRPGVPLS
jgi:hypothetical protein